MIILHDVWFSYTPGIPVLKGISLKIKEGEFIAIIGPNGSGKTTLAKHLNGLLKPEKGIVLIDGVDTKVTSVATLAKRVGYVFQNPDKFLFSETVEDELRFTLKNFGVPERQMKEYIDETLTLLNLEKFRDRSPFSLSGGEQRRVAIASVLVVKPKYLILDEPTVGQDANEKRRLADVLFNLNKKGTTIILISHDIEFVSEYASRILVLVDGRILTDGSAETVLTNEKLLKMANVIPPQIVQLFSKLRTNGFDFPRNVIKFNEALSLIYERVSKKLIGGNYNVSF
ncbi:MAG: energy-coupling factor ABC transporter ATP-binding protein [Candidatus Asgardarchaeum sp.]